MIKDEVADIISKIASLQLEAIDSIKVNNFDNGHFKLICNLFQIQHSEIGDNINKLKDYYKSLLINPEFIYLIDEYQLGICGHILFKMEDTWINSNYDGVIGAWNILHSIYDRLHPEYSLIWKI